MKIRKRITTLLLAVCTAASAGVPAGAQSAYAAQISSIDQAEQYALQEVPGAFVKDADQDYENGVLVYEVELVKGAEKYEIIYRASDAEMLEYSREKTAVSPSSNTAVISRKNCIALAKDEVKGGTIQSVTRKVDDGIHIYKVKMRSDSRYYTMKFHARTGELIDYEWKLAKTAGNTGSSSSYIGISKAEEIALAQVPGAAVVKAEFDRDDGVPVYEVELVKGRYEYEFKIHAGTGVILERDMEYDD